MDLVATREKNGVYLSLESHEQVWVSTVCCPVQQVWLAAVPKGFPIRDEALIKTACAWIARLLGIEGMT
eukprot:1159968-Pelagomonas_calceolata.AAC.8